MCVLVVEDDQLIRSILVEELIEAGYDVREAGSGDQAMALLDTLDPPISVLVTDIHMPGQNDGIALASHVAGHRPGVPVIFTTGRPDAVRTLGPHHALVRKPYVPNDIIRRIKAMLG